MGETNWLIGLTATFLIIFLAILPHELGHFLAAKVCRVRVIEFGLGLPPRISWFFWRGTKFSLGLLPLGGFCRLSEDPKDHGSFVNAPKRSRLVVLISGATGNLLASIFIYAGAVSGLRSDLAWWQTLLTGLAITADLFWFSLTTFFSAIVGSWQELGGLLSLLRITSTVATQSWQSNSWTDLLLLTAGLNISVAAFNLLPIPFLDGGRILFLAIETALRRRHQGLEEVANAAGCLILVLVIVALLVKDILFP